MIVHVCLCVGVQQRYKVNTFTTEVKNRTNHNRLYFTSPTPSHIEGDTRIINAETCSKFASLGEMTRGKKSKHIHIWATIWQQALSELNVVIQLLLKLCVTWTCLILSDLNHFFLFLSTSIIHCARYFLLLLFFYICRLCVSSSFCCTLCWSNT